MKIAANPLSFIDPAPVSTAAGGGADYGKGFENAIRDAAEDSSAKVKPRKEGAAARHDRAGDLRGRTADAGSSASDGSSGARSSANSADEDGVEASSVTAADASSTSAAGLLGRLLGNGFAVAATPAGTASAEDATGETPTDLRIVVALDQGDADPALAEDAAAGARGKVRLEVVHMETHFEPRSDAFVLVEGAEGAQQSAAAAPAAPLSFDEALAQLSQRKSDASGTKNSSVENAAALGAKGGALAGDLSGENQAVPGRGGSAANAPRQGDAVLQGKLGNAAAVAGETGAAGKSMAGRAAAADVVTLVAALARADASAEDKATIAADKNNRAAAASARSGAASRDDVDAGNADENIIQLEDDLVTTTAADADRSVRRKEANEATVEKLAARLARADSASAADARIAAKTAKAADAVVTTPLASMTGQVAGRVIDAMGSTLASQRPSDLPSEAYLRMTAGGAALKTLTIQLQPETLGKLDVSMRLVDGQLTLEIAATEAETARVLAQDRDGLRKLLQHAGFSVDDASITIVTRDNSAQPLVRAAAASDAGGAQQDAGSNAGSDANNGRRDRDPEARGQGASREEPRSPRAEERRAGRSASHYV